MGRIKHTVSSSSASHLSRKDHDAVPKTLSGAGRGSTRESGGEQEDSQGVERASLESNGLPAELAGLSAADLTHAETVLVRKVDVRMLPVCVLMYILNYLDRGNLAAARYAGHPTLEEQLHLDPNGNQFPTAISILFVGYILMQVPSNLLLNRIGRPALYLPTVMVVWGVISAVTSQVRSFGGLLAVRFILGFVEAAYFPGILFLLSAWYTRKELALRTALLGSGNLISGAFSGLIAAGITSGLDGARGIPAWRWLFIIEGAVTVFIALCAYFILPDFPANTTFLSPRERALAVWRLKEDIGQEDWTSPEKQSFWQGFSLAFKDPKTYVFMLMLITIVSSTGVTNFFPTVVNTLGYSQIDTLLLTVPPWALSVLVVFFNAWHADRTGERFLHVTIPLALAIAVFILAAATTGTAPRYVAMMLMPSTLYAGYYVSLAWISSSMPRPPAKRAAALAAINAVSNAASIYSSYLYQGFMAPRYTAAFTVNCVTAFIAIVCALILRIMLVRLNKKLARGDYVEGAVNLAHGDTKVFRFLV